jgi:hypothetical protein
MKQCKLDSFFTVTTKYDENNRKCFIYDPINKTAVFVPKPEKMDKFIDTKCNIKLFYRPYDITENYFIPKISTNLSIPLLKSNLQKAIRRYNKDIALTTTIVLLEKDPLSFLRRLPIIFVEDVCLLDSLPIIIWFMMADKQYKLTNFDIKLILNIVNSLCNNVSFFNYKTNTWKEEYSVYEHKDLQNLPNYNELLGLYYRSLYGGMKGDIKLLQSALHYYMLNPEKVHNTNFDNIDFTYLPPFITLIPEAIDFHPFPHILPQIKKNITEKFEIDIKVEDIKMCIWFAESGINFRKSDTIDSSLEYINTENWKLIKEELNRIRKMIAIEYA